MVKPRRVDVRQKEIVAALRAVGCSVQHLHMVGKGCPDIAVGRAGETYLLEIKSPGGKLTPDEERWHKQWKGHVEIVETPEEAIEAVGLAIIHNDEDYE